jgi:hypothetical protein
MQVPILTARPTMAYSEWEQALRIAAGAFRRHFKLTSDNRGRTAQ